MDRIPEKIDSKFRYVLLAAQRAEQLMRGARPKEIEARPRKPTVLAMDEVDHELVAWDYGPSPQAEPAPGEDAEAAEAGSEAGTEIL